MATSPAELDQLDREIERRQHAADFRAAHPDPVAFVLQSVFGKRDAQRFLAQPHTCSAFQVLDEIDERTEAEKSADYAYSVQEMQDADDRFGDREDFS